ncbi:MAG TPA: transcriptional regulator [Clostridiales bacterium]|nr:transcriptional regulator [Clostridiales bacterium]
MVEPGRGHELDSLLRDLSAEFRAMSRTVLTGLEITPLQYHALVFLSREDGLTMGDLCDKLLLAASTITDLVDRIETAGYVARDRCAADRRVVRIRLTPAGLRVVQEVRRVRGDWLDSLLEGMPAAGQECLLTSLRQLCALLRSRADAARSGAGA